MALGIVSTLLTGFLALCRTRTRRFFGNSTDSKSGDFGELFLNPLLTSPVKDGAMSSLVVTPSGESWNGRLRLPPSGNAPLSPTSTSWHSETQSPL